jgi:hypothetical protein
MSVRLSVKSVCVLAVIKRIGNILAFIAVDIESPDHWTVVSIEDRAPIIQWRKLLSE